MTDKEKEKLEYEIFEKTQRALIAESKAAGIQKQITKDLELEIEGLEDILEFLDNDAAEVAIKERLIRMRNILKEKY